MEAMFSSCDTHILTNCPSSPFDDAVPRHGLRVARFNGLALSTTNPFAGSRERGWNVPNRSLHHIKSIQDLYTPQTKQLRRGRVEGLADIKSIGSGPWKIICFFS